MQSPLPDPPPADEVSRRLAAFQEGLRAGGLDGALIVQDADLAYLTGCAQNAHLVVPADGEPALYVRRDLERARAESGLRRIEPLRSLRALPAALAACGLTGRIRLGLELDVLSAAAYLRYGELLPAAELCDAMPALWQARQRKSGWELERIRGACDQGRAAMQAAPGLLRPGRAEADVLSELGLVLRRHGHEGALRFRGLNHDLFFGQVLAGPSAAVPGPTETPLVGSRLSSAHGRGPSRRPLGRGDAVVVDLSGLHEGYVSDQTRTFFLGDPDTGLLEALTVCQRVLAECAGLLRPGTPASRIYEHALAVCEEAGLADHFMGQGPGRVRFVGHGIGLELNEPPFLAAGFDAPLAPGNVVAIEPKLVFAGVGAVGIENSYLVTRGAAEQLTTAREQPVVVAA